ncbi:MAG: SMC-Scp complex subunit ScpB [Candidatus Omnitrophica bacterium]|nr:SMC-Scp complex subunit ScpB [Candidatus Omnitrophota bacterium]
MDEHQVKQILEALLFVFSQPLSLKRLLEIVPDIEAPQMRALIQTLNGEYTSSGRAFHIQEVAGGYQLVTDQQWAPWIRRALQSPKPDSVSNATLETLAIIAYRQPITKAEIEAVRGVDVSASLDTLTERRFVRIAGRKESPGRPFLYGTTPEFLRHFGLKSLDALPKLETPTIHEPTAEEPTAALSPASGTTAVPEADQPTTTQAPPPESIPSAVTPDGR